jgi:hypothetical protein
MHVLRIRDQEDHSSKPVWANSFENPILKKPITKKGAGGMTQGEDPEFKSQHHKNIITKIIIYFFPYGYPDDSVPLIKRYV